jgi:hypothetical protein
MHRIFLLTLCLLPASLLTSQFNLDVTKVFGGNSLDEAKDIAVNHDTSALFFAARTFSSDIDVPGNMGGSDYWIMKRDLEGNLLWNRTYGGFNADDISNVMPHTDGGVVAFGTTRNDQGEFGELLGQGGGWLIRTNSMGALTKGKIFGGQIAEIGVDAVRHPNGDITMLMEANSPELNGQSNNGIIDVWVVQVDNNFTLKWATLLGGERQDVPAALTTDVDGNIYVIATTESDLPGLDPNFGESDVWVFKLNPFGTLLWQKNFGGSLEDIANDIHIDEDGNLFAMAHSFSNDVDFDRNYGNSDVWLIRMDKESGDPAFFKNYGGVGTETNGHISVFGRDHLILSATSNSDSVDLTGNKGVSDVWVFTVDLNGTLIQQMNYGGSQNDFAGDLMAFDSIVFLFNSTLSENKNVPDNFTSQQDLWFFTLNVFSEPCSDQFLCQQDSTLSNELFPPATDVLICVQGCTYGLERGPDFTPGNCSDFDQSTAYFKLVTDTTADLLTLSVRSDEFNLPKLALLQTGNCATFTPVACAEGEEGYVIMQFINVQPLTTYIIAISDVEGNAGTFELCATSVDVEFCNENDRLYVNLTSMGSPLSGPFLPGEEVQICYELLDWNKIDCNGFQGLVPSFGPGWDADGFDFFGMPEQIDSFLMPVANGFWDWYGQGDVRYNVSNPIGGYQGGQGMPPGWYFTNLGDPPPNDGPDQTTGDIDDCQPTPDTWKLCFTLPVEDDCQSNLDLSISMRTFSDGELGSHTSLACAYDQEETLNIGMVCCINPTIQPIQQVTICSGDTVILFPETNILPPVTYSWVADPDIGIEGATSGTNATRFYQILTNETNDILNVNYILSAEGYFCEAEPVIFSVQVYPKPSSKITLSGPSSVCAGSTVTLNFENTGTPPFAIELLRDNEFFGNVLAESAFLSIDVDPVFTGRFRVGSVQDAFCIGEGISFVNVTVKPLGTLFIDTAICAGDSLILDNEVFKETGSYQITLEEAASNNCDSVITLSLSITPSVTDFITEEICRGDTLFVLGVPYTETTQQTIEYIGVSGCTDFIELDLIVRDTFTNTINQTICGGDTLLFEGIAVFETGLYAHVEEVSPGCFEETVLNLTVLPQIVINDLSIIGDHGNNDGAILVEIVGGNPPFAFLWSNGQTTESLFNIMHGHYTLSVTDAKGCVEVFEFNVPMVTSSSGIAHEVTFRIWPSLVSTSDLLYLLHNAAGDPVIHLNWWDTNGLLLSSDEIKGHTSGNVQAVAVPTGLVPGMYFVGAYTRQGHSFLQKIFVE